MKAIKKSFFAVILCVSMLFVTAFSAFAFETKAGDELQEGWIQVSENRFENATTGEYFEIIPSTNRASAERVSFDFKIKNSFRCPTKFLASGTTATVDAWADRVDSSGRVDNSVSLPFNIEVGSKTAEFSTGGFIDSVSISGLRAGSTYTVIASSPDATNGYYIEGNATVE